MHQPLIITPISALESNYIWLAHFKDERECFVVDPGVAEPVLEYIAQYQLTLTDILITHHHGDHTNGIIELVKYNPSVLIFGPANEPILHKTNPLNGEEVCIVLNQRYQLNSYAVPGHTKGHMAYYSNYLPNQSIVFTGDTLFSGGCGRLFEGTFHQMYESLMRLKNLPEQTQVYCGHEYTINNLLFAQWLEPHNKNILAALKEAQSKRANLNTTLPSSIGSEKMINPFLRCNEDHFIKTLQKRFAMKAQTPLSVFKFIRTLKDQWSPHAISL